VLEPHDDGEAGEELEEAALVGAEAMNLRGLPHRLAADWQRRGG
jgi:hypothetical protein